MSENCGQAAQEVSSVEMEFDDLCSEQDVQEAIKKLADRLNKFQDPSLLCKISSSPFRYSAPRLLTQDDAALVLLAQLNLICSRNRLNLCAILSTEMSSTRPC